MSRHHYSYDPATGLFTGRSVRSVQTPGVEQGFALLSSDDPIDVLSKRVDITGSVPVVVDYQPPSPGDDEYQTWAWNAVLRRWVATPTLAAHKRAARQRMAGAFEAARAAGVTIGTKTAPTDSAAWTRYLAIKAMAGESGWVDVPIPLSDGTFELLNPAKAATLWASLRDMERTLLARLRDRVQNIAAATTQAEVEAVVW